MRSFTLLQQHLNQILYLCRHNTWVSYMLRKSKYSKIFPQQFFHSLNSAFFKVQFMQQFTQKFLPVIFNNTWVTNSIRRAGQNHVELRNAENLAIPFSRTITISRLPLFSFPRIWEEFPSEHIKFLRDKTEFNFNLKDFLLSQLLDIPTCERLFCPSCLTVN